ncbi:MAG: 2'-5' RNA ligase family protein [Massilia sp.]|nr:2'-5' RNA ligase family protein [Massilia sp.]
MNDADTARVFIALWPDDAIRAALRAWRDGGIWPASASPVRTEQLHLTLHFLGNVPRARLPELVRGLDVRCSPFELGFGHGELWHGGIAVLVPDAIPAPLLALHGALGAALDRLDLAPETRPGSPYRPYRPHVTLARHAGATLAPIAGPLIRWQVDGYALMESTLDAGAHYTIVHAYAANAFKGAVSG